MPRILENWLQQSPSVPTGSVFSLFPMLPVQVTVCTVAVHLGKREHTLLAFSVLPMSLIHYPDFPGCYVQGCSAGLRLPAGDPSSGFLS